MSSYHNYSSNLVVTEEIKKSYDEMPEPPESVPLSAVIDKIKAKVNLVKQTNPGAKFLFDSLPGTTHEDFSQVCDFMGVPDFVLNLLASEES